MENLRIKEEYFDVMISHPMNGSLVNPRFLEWNMYNYFYNNGYKHIFELIVEKKEDKNKDK